MGTISRSIFSITTLICRQVEYLEEEDFYATTD